MAPGAASARRTTIYLNRMLLATLANLTGEPTLVRFAVQWDPADMSLGQRIALFATFTRLKNRSRPRSWRGR